jgi:hypothetical protein
MLYEVTLGGSYSLPGFVGPFFRMVPLRTGLDFLTVAYISQSAPLRRIRLAAAASVVDAFNASRWVCYGAVCD